MLEEIMSDALSRSDASNQPMFSDEIDYGALVAARAKALEEWGKLTKDKQDEIGGQVAFETARGIRNLKDPNLAPAKNFHLLSQEAKKRILSQDDFQLLPIDAIDFDESVLELAESLENTDDIRALYRLRKKTVGTTKNAGINVEEAERLKNCFSQGRELYLAGKQGSLMVKPLNFFYSLTAYSYGIIILNNPLRYSKGGLPGSHGMSYLPATIQAQFGGDTARGTFSDLMGSFPTQLIKTRNAEINIDCTDSLVKFYHNRFNVSLGLLLSMIPEMSEYYKLTTNKRSRCFPLEIVNSNASRSLKWEFHIGDGESKPTAESISNSFSAFHYTEKHGKFVVDVPDSEASKIRACIYTDIRGATWYVENPFFPIMLPEICIHFLISNIFSSIMRYRPDEWGSVLSNDVSSSISLMTRHYFSSFQRKYFLVILRSSSRYMPYASYGSL